MSVGLGAAVGGAALFVVAGLLEEATHAAAAAPFAVRQRFEWRRLEVVHELPVGDDARGVDAVDVWIALAPCVVGLAAAVLAVAGNALPAAEMRNILIYVAWVWYTVPSLTDIQAAAGVEPAGDGWDDPRYRDAWHGILIQCVGILVLAGGWADITVWLLGDAGVVVSPAAGPTATAQFRLSRSLRLLGIALVPAGAIWALAGVWIYEHNHGDVDDEAAS